MKKEDQRIKVSKELIRRSYAKLVLNNDDDKISVKAICDDAGINRGTFYTHYKDVQDLNEQIKQDFFVDFQKGLRPLLVKAKFNLIDDEELVPGILKVLKRNKDICKIMVAGRPDFAFLTEITAIGHEAVKVVYPQIFKNKSQKQFDDFYYFASAGCINLLIRWIRNDMAQDEKEIANTLNLLVNSTLKYFDIN